MKTTMKAAILLFTIAMSGMSQGALAATPCEGEFDLLNFAITDANFGDRKNADRDEERMLWKVQEAISKVNHEKYDDAIQKLGDIVEKAEALASAPKLKLEDDSGIRTAAMDVAVCINSL